MSNRVLKFRVWDNGMGEPFNLYDELTDLDDARTGWLKSAVFLQYTGLKDRNGVEIYEGDIVNVINLFVDEKEPYEVVYLDDKACWFLRCNDGGHVFDPDYIKQVIGNIYENPELLNE